MSEIIRIDFVLSAGSAVESLRKVLERFDASSEPVAIRPKLEQEGLSRYRFVHERTAPPLSTILEAAEPNADNRSWTMPAEPTIELRIDTDELRLSDRTDRVAAVCNLVVDIYNVLDSRPTYVYGLDPAHAEAVGSFFGIPAEATALAADRISDVSWLMLFPPDLVESYGREFLLNAPAWRTDELDDGSILVVSWENPTNVEAFDVNIGEVREYFGIDPPGPDPP